MHTTKITINNSISGILTLPSSENKYPAVLFLHGFASDKNEVNNIYEYMSEKLASDGILSLRIDFRCWGDSAGSTQDSTIEKMIDDAILAVEYLKNHPNVDAENISIIGFSLGAAISVLTTKYISCQSLTLISPALHLADDIKIFLGEPIINQLKEPKNTVEINLPWKKIKLSNEFYLSLLQHDPGEHIKSFTGYLHCVAGDNDFSRENAKEIHKIAGTENKLLTIVDNADHIFSLSNGKNILQNVANDIISNFSNRLSSNKTARFRP